MPGPDLQQLTPSLHRLRIPTGPAHLLNCYLWLEPDGVTLVDTGWPDSADLIADALAALGRQRADVRRIVLTHFHEDHTGSAAEIANWSTVEVIAGAGDAPFVSGARRGPLPRLTDLEKTIHAETDEPSHGPPCRVDREVVDGDVLDFAGGARVIGVPGHTPGSIALYLPEADAVLTGDAVAEFDGAVILGVFDTDREAATRSLAKLAATRAEIAGFGHGEAVRGGAHERIATATDPFAPSAEPR
ncbi:MBL fold metallo-hydrolase [Prescottella agglutinans]|uniref:MBL fold metallo-hydrolase n=1 Tax=Prescottella agglutinans TaxID=1644129 RepID=A0A438BC45_9NOCA|nr:MBL fold metallo-hydrolase [Prescottella agglutinans]RVW08421.1 MBL fold metallo-hydrolase [Prescottella agglutinans]